MLLTGKYQHKKTQMAYSHSHSLLNCLTAYSTNDGTIIARMLQKSSNMKQEQWVLITGATSGIGKELAKLFANDVIN